MTDEALRIPAGRLAAVLGDAYRRASVEGADVAQVVGLLEPVRAAVAEKDPFAPWRRFDAVAGQAAGTTAAPIVAQARSDYVAAVADGVRHAVTAGGGADLWLRLYARALGVFRVQLLSRMAEAPPPGLAGHEVCRATPHIVAGQWDEAMPAVLALIEHPAVDRADRALLMVIAGEVAMYWDEDGAAATAHLDRAREIAPDEARVWDGYGSVALRDDDVDAALPAYRRAVELDPSLDNGYSGLGLCAVARDDLSTAEAEYLRGVKECPDGAEVRLSLLRLYGRTGMFAEHEKALPRLADEVLAIDPQSDYDLEIALGNAYRDNDQHAAARRHYEKAVALRPTRSLAYEERGHLELMARDTDEAERQFAEVVRLSRGRWSGAYGMALVFQQRGLNEEALREFRRCLSCPSPLIRSFIRARIAETQLELDRVDAAAEDVAAGLAEDPSSSDLRERLRQVAIRMWADRPADARALLDRFRVGGTGAEAAAHAALVGEIASTAGDNATAVECYREAVRLDGGNAFHGRSLAVVLTVAKQWDEARAAIEGAFRADGDSAERDRALAVLENQRGHTFYEKGEFAEAATIYGLAATLVPSEPVYHSNLALAHEAQVVPGHRLAALEAAVAALEVTVTLSDDADYAQRLLRLRSTAAAVRRYGETILTAGTVNPLRCAVAPDLVPAIDPQRDGTDFITREIPALRDRIRDAVGIEIPGLRFREEAYPAGAFQLEIWGVPMERGTVTGGVTELLPRLEGALVRHAWRLLRTDELDQLITEAVADGVSARARLGVGLILRALLRDGIPLRDLPAVIRAIEPGELRTSDVPAALGRARRAALRSLPAAPVALDEPADASPERPPGWTRPLAPAQESELAAAVRARPPAEVSVFVTGQDRAYRQQLLAAELPGRTVLVLSPGEVAGASS